MSALKNKPNLQEKAQNYLNQSSGMFGANPNKLMNKMDSRLTGLNAKLAKMQSAGKDTSKLQEKINNLNSYKTQIQNSAPVQQQQYQQNVNQTYGQMNQVNQQANQGMQQQMNYIQQQGKFNPNGLPDLNKDYTDWRKQAEDNVMSAFNRQMTPEFDRQKKAFDEQMALQGKPVGSEAYNLEYQQMMDSQNSARQNAMSQAFTAGQGEQAQAYGQAANTNQQMYGQQYQTYQTPYQNLGAFQPYYAGQMNMVGNQQNYLNQAGLQNSQNAWQAGQNQQEWQNQQKLAAMAGRGGGGGGGGAAPNPYAGMNGFYDDWINNVYPQYQQNQQQGNTTNAAVGGATNMFANIFANSMVK